MPPSPTNAPPAAPGGRRLRAFAWVLYDLANTVYAATLTYLLTPYAKAVLGDLRGFGLVSFGSMVLAGLAVPVLGALADQTARAGRYLAIATLACIAAIAGFGLSFGGDPAFGSDLSFGSNPASGSNPAFGGAWLLGCFFVANVAYNLGLLFYNVLLPSVAAPGREGRLSGLGTGLGYLGTLVVLGTLMPLDVTEGTRFQLAALLFLVTAAPCLLLVHERRAPRPGPRAAAVRQALAELRGTLRELPGNRPLLWFLLGNFCLLDVLNTAILYFADFTRTVFAEQAAAGTLQFLGNTLSGDAGLRTLLIQMGALLNTLALVAGIVQGPWSDRAPLSVLRASAVALAIALAGGAWFGGHSTLGYTATLLACGAFGLAGVQTAGRKMIVLLAPPERLGSCFGLYGITVKLSVLGSVVYGFVEHQAGAKPAMLAQGMQLLLGLGCLAMVRMPVRPPPPAPPA